MKTEIAQDMKMVGHTKNVPDGTYSAVDLSGLMWWEERV